MSSWQARLTSSILRQTLKRRLARAENAAQASTSMNISLQLGIPSGVRIREAPCGGVPGEWVEPTAREVAGTLLYLHGGGYFTCSPRTHRPITTAFAKAGFRVFAPDYRLAPEYPFPAAVLDAVASYRGLREAADAPLVIAGDSAGGGLSLSTMLTLRDQGDRLPKAAALFSPFTDLTGSGASRQTNDKRCAMFSGTGLEWVPLAYAGQEDPRNPLASPLWADLTGLPPLLIHVGADETLLDDSTRLAESATAAGVTVELRIWPAVPHVWQIFHRFIPEGRESLMEASAFLRTALAATQ
jgi:monoterpene epsilon-lactone hydrolase